MGFIKNISYSEKLSVIQEKYHTPVIPKFANQLMLFFDSGSENWIKI